MSNHTYALYLEWDIKVRVFMQALFEVYDYVSSERETLMF